MAKKYSIEVWDIQFYKVDEDGNELLNEDGSVKLFSQSRDIDLSWVSDSVYEEDVVEKDREDENPPTEQCTFDWTRKGCVDCQD